jgi:hypothetical protein
MQMDMEDLLSAFFADVELELVADKSSFLCDSLRSDDKVT